jgi:hypothetical protein
MRESKQYGSLSKQDNNMLNRLEQEKKEEIPLAIKPLITDSVVTHSP